MVEESIFMSLGDGSKLKILRDKMGLSVSELSEKTSISPSFIRLLEKGCFPLATRDKSKISSALGLQDNWFEVIDSNKNIQSILSKQGEGNAFKKKIEDKNHTVLNNKQQENKTIIENGNTLKSIRIANGLSRNEIAEAIGVTSVQIGYIENGKRTLTEKVKIKLNDYFAAHTFQPNNINYEGIENNNRYVLKDGIDQSVIRYNEEILNKIRKIKEEKGYTQSVVADKSGVNRSQLCMIEKGKIRISRNVKIKLTNFIDSELNQNVKDNDKISSVIEADSNISKIENKDFSKYDKSVRFNNKYELFKVIESMKETRDELNHNINMLEQVFESI